jgi:isoleucyl-tRNA synthetase
VKRIELTDAEGAFGGWRAKPNFRVLGPRHGPRVQAVAAALQADDGTLARSLAAGNSVELGVDDGPAVAIGPEDVELSQEIREGWGVASDGGLTVALELEVTPALRLEGLARELIRIVQDARKTAGLHVTDRIVLAVESGGVVRDALVAHRDMIGAETLAATVADVGIRDAEHREEANLDGERVVISLSRA